MNRRRRRLGLCVLAALVLIGCGVPDAERFQSTRTPLSPSATSDSSSSATSTSTTTTSATSSTTSTTTTTTTTTTPLAQQLGAQAVVPWGQVTQDDIDRAVVQVSTMTTLQKSGAVVMASSANAVGTGLVGDLGLGGVILMGAKGILDGTTDGTPAEVAEVTATLHGQAADEAAGFPLLIGTDQEFGVVTRLQHGFTDLPSAGELGDVADLDAAVGAAQQAASLAASEMTAVGINVDFAPVSDVLPSSGSSSIGNRSYGTDPTRVSALVTAAVAGYQAGGVAATLKHFPGIGELKADTHEVLSTVKASCEQWNSVASVPIRAGVAAGVGLVMTGHALFPAADPGPAPTSLSTIVVTDLLRGDPAAPLAGGCTPIGFRGLTVSDSLQMQPITDNYTAGEAAWRALAAGEDLLLMPPDPAAAVAGIETAVVAGQLAETRLNEAAVRVYALRSALGRSPRPALDTVNSAANQAIADQVWAVVN